MNVLLAGGESVKSGPIGFAVILVLCVMCYFLFKSMSKHLRKVREEFPTDEPPATPGAPDGPAQPEQSEQPAQPDLSSNGGELGVERGDRT